jgi:hypothetical protein
LLGGCLRPSCARPLGLAARASPRLLDIASSGCLPSCLLCSTSPRLSACLAVVRGTTRLRPVGLLSPAPESLRYWSCTPSAAPPVPVCLLGAPPTGGTHFESNARRAHRRTPRYLYLATWRSGVGSWLGFHDPRSTEFHTGHRHGGGWGYWGLGAAWRKTTAGPPHQ